MELAKRMECVQLVHPPQYCYGGRAGAVEGLTCLKVAEPLDSGMGAFKSGSKLHALHALRVFQSACKFAKRMECVQLVHPPQYCYGGRAGAVDGLTCLRVAEALDSWLGYFNSVSKIPALTSN